jgi:hypothetical protein
MLIRSRVARTLLSAKSRSSASLFPGKARVGLAPPQRLKPSLKTESFYRSAEALRHPKISWLIDFFRS